MKKKEVKKTKKVVKKPEVFDEAQMELLSEFKKNHTVLFHYGMTEVKAVVLGFSKDGVIVREYGQQDKKEYKASEIEFITDLGVE